MSEVADEIGVDPVEPQAEEQAAVEETVAEPAAPAADDLGFDPVELQAELDYTRSQNQELQQLLSQFVDQYEGNQQESQSAPDLSGLTDEYGNLRPEGLLQILNSNNEQLLGQVGQMFQSVQAPLAAQQEAQVVAEGNQRLQDIIADDVSRNGEFASDPEADANARELVTTLASTIFPDVAQRYGSNPRAAEIAMSRAAQQVRGLLQSAGVAAVTQNQNQLANLASKNGEPGVGGPGTEAPVVKIGEKSVNRFAGTFGAE